MLSPDHLECESKDISIGFGEGNETGMRRREKERMRAEKLS